MASTSAYRLDRPEPGTQQNEQNEQNERMGAGQPEPNQLTIEQLAHETGMSVRNIRSHQARGLLAPPEVRMRVGYYGAEHVAQLRLIRELQDEGFNLNGIKRLLDDTHGTAERLLSFKATLTAPLHDEQAEMITIEELATRFPLSPEDAPEVLAKAQRLGALVPVGNDQYEVPSPSLLAVAEEISRRGISVQSALSILEEVERHCDSVGRAFVKLFLREVWKPFQEAGMPADRWPEIEESIERLRPIASEALIAIFHQRMTTQIESAFGEITKRLSEGGRPSGRRR
jgi:DNA-binding transcriptional MerR regulator